MQGWEDPRLLAQTPRQRFFLLGWIVTRLSVQILLPRVTRGRRPSRAAGPGGTEAGGSMPRLEEGPVFAVTCSAGGTRPGTVLGHIHRIPVLCFLLLSPYLFFYVLEEARSSGGVGD